MKNKLLLNIIAVMLLTFPKVNFGQAPNLGRCSSFELFTAVGAFHAIGASYVTGDIGTNVGAFTGFPPGTLVGTTHVVDSVSVQAAIDVDVAYSYLFAVTCDTVIGTTLGNSQVLKPGVYCLGAASTLNDTLFLDAQGNSNALFIIKIDGALSTSTHSHIILMNSASLCNVYWQINGAFSLGDSSVFRGTIIANGAISLLTGSALYGRGLSRGGAINISAVIASLPTSCSSCAPTITTAPTNKVACFGTSTGFSVVATGTSLTYQWRKGTVNLINTGNISGASSATLTINPVSMSDTASNYNVIVTGTCSQNHSVTNVSLAVNTLPLITTVPANQTICSGVSVGFSVVATGSALTYQWRKGTVNLTNTGNITGATSATLTINPATTADAATNYNVVVSGICSPAATSANTILTVNAAPAITAQPTNQTACPAGSLVDFSVTATGTNLTYQWRKGTVNLTNGGKISGATSATLTINPANISDTASNYNVVISGICSPVVNSSNVSLVINTGIIITTAPANQTACAGSSSGFSIVAMGAGLTYQWRKGTVNISGATSASLIINPVTIADTASNYNVVIGGTCSANVTSSNVSLTINYAPAIVTSPSNQTICAGGSATFLVAATGTALSYQWRKGTVNISGATSASLVINPVTIADAATNYNVVISGTCSPNITSANVSLTVNTAPTLTTTPSNQTICAGGSASFSVIATGNALTYQWRKGTVNLTNAGNISGATSALLTINPATIADVSASYNVVITGTCSPVLTSANVSLTVNTAPVLTTAPSNQTVCLGTVATFSVAATGSALTYQWRKGTVNLINAGNISGATSANLTINSVTLSDANANYNVVITGACSPNITSANVSLTVNTAAVIITQPVSQMSTDHGSISFTVLASGGGLTYQWRKGTVNLTNGGNISGATTATLTINPVNQSDTSSYYNVVISGPCSANIISENVILFVCICPTTGIASIDASNTKDVSIYPNPFTTSINVVINDASQINNAELIIYNVLGAMVMITPITKQLTTLETSKLPSGIYIYKVIGNNKIIQSGRLISK